MVISTRDKRRRIAASFNSGSVESDPRVRNAREAVAAAIREHEQAEREHADALAVQNAAAAKAAAENDAGKRQQLAAEAVKAREVVDKAALGADLAEQRVAQKRAAVADALAAVRAERVAQKVVQYRVAQQHLIGYLVGGVNAVTTMAALNDEIAGLGGQRETSVLPPVLASTFRAPTGNGGAIEAVLRDADERGIIGGWRKVKGGNGLIEVAK